MKLKRIKVRSILYIFSALSFLILLPFTSYYYSSLQESLREREEYSDKLEKKSKQLKKLNEMESNIEKDKDVSSYIKKLSSSFDREKLLKYFYNFVEKNSSSENMIKVKWISFYELWKSDLWFSQWEIRLRMYFGNKNAMKTFLNFIVSKDSDYIFFLDNFSYPDFGNESLEKRGFDMNISLKIYYK